MGFLDKAKQAANELAAKADTAINQSGLGGSADSRESDRLLRNLGVLAYREQSGMPVDPSERESVVSALRDLERQGRLGPLTLSAQGGPGASPPPPPPGMAGNQPPPPPGMAGQQVTPPPGPMGDRLSNDPYPGPSPSEGPLGERPSPPPPPPPPPSGF